MPLPYNPYRQVLGKDLQVGMQYWGQGHIFQIDKVTYETDVQWCSDPNAPRFNRYCVESHWVGGPDPGPGYHKMSSGLREDLTWAVLLENVIPAKDKLGQMLEEGDWLSPDGNASLPIAARVVKIMPGLVEIVTGVDPDFPRGFGGKYPPPHAPLMISENDTLMESVAWVKSIPQPKADFKK